ncbi:iron chelate uptake ABC transporter family permease subunit [Micromonospora polyrhachis]|uniref:Iron complex transport system permease protein n=2 Tax=Micromonospora polyrhachis TaxID=1282883 RepID=A0A7W7WTH5_9ACTN|nr:iron complex transport system permease protein [Micromonospora polyrhachis]
MTAMDHRSAGGVGVTLTPALRSPTDRFSVRLRRRPLLVSLLLLVLAVGTALFSLSWGSAVPVAETLAALVGAGTPATDLVVFQIRLPRVLGALLVGICLGVAGAQFQSLTRNPLGSPDIVGFTSGASAGAVFVLLVIGEQAMAVSTGAIGFGLATAVIMYLLSWRRGVNGVRLVLVGVAVSAMLESVTAYLLIQADIYESQAAHVWLVGSLAATKWDQVWLLVGVIVLLVPAAVMLSRPLDQLSLGDEAARSLGLRVERTRLAVLATAVILSGVSVAAVGPIAFVALAAPQLARRLTAGPGVGVIPAAFMGALLLCVADLVARLLPLPGQLPVGVVTGGLGGGYLAWLLWREHRSGRA